MKIVLPIVAAAAIIAGGIVIAGPLTPPGGPVAGTYKTLSEVEPRIALSAANTPGDADSLYKITAPGSYYLTGNVFGASGKHGIEVIVSGVTIDLGGFSMLGSVGSLDGISLTAARSSIAVHNGSLIAWGGDGVDLANATSSRLTDLCTDFNAGAGIIAGDSSTITRCEAQGNGGAAGIKAHDAAVVSDCSARANTAYGFSLNAGCTVMKCGAWDNGSSGIWAGAGCTVADCASGDNAVDGITLWTGSTIRGNTCYGNGLGAGTGAGIRLPALGGEARIEGNNCTWNETGIQVQGNGCIILRNTCSTNTTNWNIVVGNSVAPIISTPNNIVPIIGNSYAGSLGSTDPNANFSF